ncbi:MAG: hypothetical protein SGCHY_004144, partial [Lobulomycetales sp.]
MSVSLTRTSKLALQCKDLLQRTGSSINIDLLKRQASEISAMETDWSSAHSIAQQKRLSGIKGKLERYNNLKASLESNLQLL